MSVTPETEQTAWALDSWKSKPMQQAIAYPSQEDLDKVVDHLATLPPLVTSWEIERLRTNVALAASGERFILQGGDCAESFSCCNSPTITNKLKILLQMSLVLIDGLKRPIIRIGRIAGQYAKPRSKPTEMVGGVEMGSYFGDLINGSEATVETRTPNPERLVAAYHHAAMTLNFIRALIDGGFTDLHHPEYWDLNCRGSAAMTPDLKAAYLRRVENVANAIEVMEAITTRPIDKVTQVEFYTSHEGLSLPYESALTRQVPRRKGWYNLGCHMPWIGERTRALDSAHIEYSRGIRNPIGVKIGPKATPEEVLSTLEALNPNNEPGRMVLIARMGSQNVEKVLPDLVATVKSAGRNPAWMCDPMHGNTFATKSGIKTRHVDSILEELIASIDVHEKQGTVLAGVHFELTAENVTECLGGASGVTEKDLDTAYESLCDPRLNYEQAMEVAFAIARRMEGA